MPESLWNRAFILCLFNNLFLFTYYFATLTILPIYILQDLGGTVKDAGLALTLFLLSSGKSGDLSEAVSSFYYILC